MDSNSSNTFKTTSDPSRQNTSTNSNFSINNLLCPSNEKSPTIVQEPICNPPWLTQPPQNSNTNASHFEHDTRTALFHRYLTDWITNTNPLESSIPSDGEQLGGDRMTPTMTPTKEDFGSWIPGTLTNTNEQIKLLLLLRAQQSQANQTNNPRRRWLAPATAFTEMDQSMDGIARETGVQQMTRQAGRLGESGVHEVDSLGSSCNQSISSAETAGRIVTTAESLFPMILHNNSSKSARRRKARTVFSDHQLLSLEHRFETKHYLSTPERIELANQLNLSETQVKTWFQNRRMKHKKMKRSYATVLGDFSTAIDHSSPSSVTDHSPADNEIDTLPSDNHATELLNNKAIGKLTKSPTTPTTTIDLVSLMDESQQQHGTIDTDSKSTNHELTSAETTLSMDTMVKTIAQTSIKRDQYHWRTEMDDYIGTDWPLNNHTTSSSLADRMERIDDNMDQWYPSANMDMVMMTMWRMMASRGRKSNSRVEEATSSVHPNCLLSRYLTSDQQHSWRGSVGRSTEEEDLTRPVHHQQQQQQLI